MDSVEHLAGQGRPTAPPHRADRPHPTRRPSGEPPPIPRSFSAASKRWLVFVAITTVGWLALLSIPAVRESLSQADGELVAWVADQRVSWLDRVVGRTYNIAYTWAAPIIGWVTVVVVLFAKRLRHALVFLTGIVVTVALAGYVATLVERPRPFGVEILGRWEGFSHPSWTAAVMASLLTGAWSSRAQTRVPATRNG